MRLCPILFCLFGVALIGQPHYRLEIWDAQTLDPDSNIAGATAINNRGDAAGNFNPQKATVFFIAKAGGEGPVKTKTSPPCTLAALSKDGWAFCDGGRVINESAEMKCSSNMALERDELRVTSILDDASGVGTLMARVQAVRLQFSVNGGACRLEVKALPPLAHHKYTYAWALNQKGDAGGYSGKEPNAKLAASAWPGRAVIWKKGVKAPVALPDLAKGEVPTMVTGINEAGVAVGNVQLAATEKCPAPRKAFIATPEGKGYRVEYLPAPEGVGDSCDVTAFGIDGNDRIAGNAVVGGTTTGVVWTRGADGQFRGALLRDIVYENAQCGEIDIRGIKAMNTWGQIVGSVRCGNKPNTESAFLATLDAK